MKLERDDKQKGKWLREVKRSRKDKAVRNVPPSGIPEVLVLR